MMIFLSIASIVISCGLVIAFMVHCTKQKEKNAYICAEFEQIAYAIDKLNSMIYRLKEDK